jgi:hypothetical protein
MSLVCIDESPPLNLRTKAKQDGTIGIRPQPEPAPKQPEKITSSQHRKISELSPLIQPASTPFMRQGGGAALDQSGKKVPGCRLQAKGSQMEEMKAPVDGKNRSFEAVPQDRLYRVHPTLRGGFPYLRDSAEA